MIGLCISSVSLCFPGCLTIPSDRSRIQPRPSYAPVFLILLGSLPLVLQDILFGVRFQEVITGFGLFIRFLSRTRARFVHGLCYGNGSDSLV